MPLHAGRHRASETERSAGTGNALPPGHAGTWGAITHGTVLQGAPYPHPVPGRSAPHPRPSEEAPP